MESSARPPTAHSSSSFVCPGVSRHLGARSRRLTPPSILLAYSRRGSGRRSPHKKSASKPTKASRPTRIEISLKALVLAALGVHDCCALGGQAGRREDPQ